MAHRSFTDRYYNGKPNKADLPSRSFTDKPGEMLVTVLRERFFSLVGLNLLYLIAWIPAIMATAYLLISYDFLVQTYSTPVILRTYVVVLALMTAITGPSRMGITYVTRNWARDDHADAVSDFAEGFRKNWKQGLAYSCIYSVYLAATGMSFIHYLVCTDSDTVWPILILVSSITIVVELSIQILPMMLVTYEGKFFSQLKNAVIITIAELPKAVLTRLLTLNVPILGYLICMLIPEAFPTVLGIITTLYLFLIPVLNHLLANHYANRLCTKYLKPANT